MHGVSSGCSLLVNAEVDSMGGVIGSEDGIGTKTSPHRAAVEKAQAELRSEYDVREERRRELEYLEKGGNPLDFRFGLAASLSVQSTSLIDQPHDQFVTSKAKGSFAVANSPRGDSVESSGRLGATVPCEPNSADNFDGENALIENERRGSYPGRSNIIPSGHSSQLDGRQHVKMSEGSPSFLPNKAYKRRNRSKGNRDTARFSSTSIASHGGLSSSLPSRPEVVCKAVMPEPLSDTEMDVDNAITMNPHNGCFSEGKLDIPTSRGLHEDMQNEVIKDDKVLAAMTSLQPESFTGREETIPAVRDCPPCSGTEKPEDDVVPEQLSEPNQFPADGKYLQSEDIVSNAPFISKGLDSESSCTQTSLSIEGNGNMDSDLCTSLKNVECNYDNEHKVPIECKTNRIDDLVLEDRKASYITEKSSCLKDNHIPRSFAAADSLDKGADETNKSQPSVQNEANSHSKSEEMLPNQLTNTLADKKQGFSSAFISEAECCCQEKPQGTQDPSVQELIKTGISGPVPLELPPPAGNQIEVFDKAHEDRILEEARIIEVKLKRIKELSIGPLPKEYRRKSHWDYVLEEMVWMANDFAQECLWKRISASQLCQRAAFASRVKLEEQNKQSKDKIVAQTLARAVMEFWQSAGLHAVQTGTISGFEAHEDGKVASGNNYDKHNVSSVNGALYEEPCPENTKPALQRYMIRFMQHNNSVVRHANIEALGTPERECLMDIPEMASFNQRTEDDLFYVVPHGAMEAYRKSIEIYAMECEEAGKNVQVDGVSSMNDAFADFGSQESEYEEDEGDSMYHFSGATGGQAQPKFIQKRGKNPKSYTPKAYEVDRDFPYDHCMENRISTPQLAVVRKRPPNGLNAGPIPTKRVRTASRQRVVGPTMGGAGFIPVPRRTDASSGDTNSFQDDQSTLHGGSFVPRGLEVESRMDFDKQSTFDSAEITVKPKKKKKTKHQGEAYGRWQVDVHMQSEKKDHLKRRMEYHQFESNGNGGMLGPHTKKLKIIKQSMDNSYETTSLMSGSVPSPVGSQMSNMSNQNKLIKLISGRDRGRKSKSFKMPSGQTGSGSPWSLFEDQALVVLVHDMGPNWELVSDAINSTLYFKCIFRKPKECKERHKILIEKSCTDGADSAEDSGSSQPYPSTLPGIPKGGARQLFQQLRGPIEEDTIKSHFEKIILLGQQLHGRKKQDPKQLVPVHGSHATALLQVIPNNVNGDVLTPLDLCDMAASSPDVFSLNYQSPHSGGLPLANQSIAQSMLQGPSGMGLGGNLASASPQVNTSASGRYGAPRTSVPIDEQHRVQQYNHMVSARNIHQTNTLASGNDRGLRMPPGGNDRIRTGMSRNLSTPRPGLQGVSASPLLNTANAVASNMASVPSSTNMQSGASSGQGNSLLQPRDALHMVRAGQNSEHPRQMMSTEMQLPATQAHSQGVATFGGSNSTFLNPSAAPSVPSYPVHHLQGAGGHPVSAEQQAFAMRLARERQLQQRLLQRQQQFPTSSALPSHGSHHPLSNGAQPQANSLRPSSPMTPVTSQQQPKLQVQHHELSRMPQNGVGKQRQRPAQQLQPQFQQSGRHHPPQRQLSQTQNQAKSFKGVGKGNMLMPQNLPVDSSHTNGLPASPGCQTEKGEQGVHPTGSQGTMPSGVQSRNHPHFKAHPSPVVKLVNHQRAVSQNCVSDPDRPLVNTPLSTTSEIPISSKQQQAAEHSPHRHPLPHQHPHSQVQNSNSSLE